MGFRPGHERTTRCANSADAAVGLLSVWIKSSFGGTAVSLNNTRTTRVSTTRQPHIIFVACKSESTRIQRKQMREVNLNEHHIALARFRSLLARGVHDRGSRALFVQHEPRINFGSLTPALPCPRSSFFTEQPTRCYANSPRAHRRRYRSGGLLRVESCWTAWLR